MPANSQNSIYVQGTKGAKPLPIGDISKLFKENSLFLSMNMLKSDYPEHIISQDESKADFVSRLKGKDKSAQKINNRKIHRFGMFENTLNLRFNQELVGLYNNLKRWKKNQECP